MVSNLSDEHELMTETPWQTLGRLVEGAATGELILASSGIEIHVYLLDGRVAWATSSTVGNEFLRWLIEEDGIASEVLYDVIEECQRIRGRIGEMLIAWGIATLEQVCNALRCHIAEVLAAVIAHPEGRSLFLPRRMAYTMEFTFSLAELERGLDVKDAVTRSDAAQQIVTGVLDGVPDAVWVEAIERGEVIARAARGAVKPTAAVKDLQRLLGEHDIEALTLRSAANGAVLGQHLRGTSGAVWCGVGSGAKLWVTSRVLASAAGVEPVVRGEAIRTAPWHEIVDPGAGFIPSVFSLAKRSNDELVAGFVLGDQGGPTGVWRCEDGLDAHAAWARRLAPALGTEICATFRCSVAARLYERVALRAVVGNTVYYGMRIPKAALVVWLAVRAWVSQGLGWALLQSVSRQIGGEA